MWKWVGEVKGVAPLTGVPAMDYDDEAFAEVSASYSKRNGFPPNALEESGLFEHQSPRARPSASDVTRSEDAKEG